MSLIDSFTVIRQSLSSAPSIRAFSHGVARRPALAPYVAPLAALAAVAPDSPLTIDERDAILVALLDELHLTKDPFWHSMLLLAFEPLIVRLRARLGQPKAVRFGRSTGEELDQRVLLTFLEIADSIRLTSHAARMLRLALERKVFTDQRVEREAPKPAEFDDDTYWADKFAVSTGDKAAAGEVVRIIEAEGGEALRDMMLATRANRESLRAYVLRTYPERTDRERAAICRRLTDAAVRVERKLRARARRPSQRRISAA
jgi:hypothetical protein